MQYWIILLTDYNSVKIKTLSSSVKIKTLSSTVKRKKKLYYWQHNRFKQFYETVNNIYKLLQFSHKNQILFKDPYFVYGNKMETMWRSVFFLFFNWFKEKWPVILNIVKLYKLLQFLSIFCWFWIINSFELTNYK